MKLSEPYVSIDLETTGLDPGFCQILEFGAVLDNLEDSLEKLPKFHAYIVHDEIIGQPYALQMNAAILKKLTTKNKRWPPYLSEELLFPIFKAWLDLNGVKDCVTAAGKNFASFDLQFLKTIVDFDISIFRHRSIDPAVLYWKPEIDGSWLPSLSTCMKRARLNTEVEHNAVDDALIVVKLIRHVFNSEGENDESSSIST